MPMTNLLERLAQRSLVGDNLRHRLGDGRGQLLLGAKADPGGLGVLAEIIR